MPITSMTAQNKVQTKSVGGAIQTASKDMKRIPFDLEKAKAGAKIVTRDGAAVEMTIFHDGYFLGTFETEEHGKLACAWNNNGKTYNTTPNKPYYLDLELLVEE